MAIFIAQVANDVGALCIDVPKEAALLALIIFTGQTTIYTMVQSPTLATGTAALSSNMSELLTAIAVGLFTAITSVTFGTAVVAHWLAI